MTEPVSHAGTFVVTQRDPATGVAMSWLATCACRDTFIGRSYHAVEDAWRQHVWARTGIVPAPMGDRLVQRWQPPV